jgi:hypothetical protein
MEPISTKKVGVHKWQSPIAGWFTIENPIKYMNMDDDWGYPHDLGNLHVVI